jgi:hypothetical protein
MRASLPLMERKKVLQDFLWRSLSAPVSVINRVKNDNNIIYSSPNGPLPGYKDI